MRFDPVFIGKIISQRSVDSRWFFPLIPVFFHRHRTENELKDYSSWNV